MSFLLSGCLRFLSNWIEFSSFFPTTSKKAPMGSFRTLFWWCHDFVGDVWCWWTSFLFPPIFGRLFCIHLNCMDCWGRILYRPNDYYILTTVKRNGGCVRTSTSKHRARWSWRTSKTQIWKILGRVENNCGFLFTLFRFTFEDPLQPMQIESQSQTQINDNSLASQNQSVQNETNETPQHYLVKIDHMKENDTSTLEVDFRHVVSFDQDLAEAIELQFYRLDFITFEKCWSSRLTPFLRRAIQNVVRKRYPDFIVHEDRDREFWISFYNSLAIYKYHNQPSFWLTFFRIRELNTSKLGKLSCIKGTVTRTSEVRPELVYGSFQCLDCRVNFNNVEQQFRYTEVCHTPNYMLIKLAVTM